MTEPGPLQKLEEEIEQLSRQLRQQQHTIENLRRQVQALSPHKPAMPQPPARPSLQPQASLENLIGLRLIHLIGIIVLVIGLSLGVKYAIDANLISEKLRILLAYLAGGLLLFFAVKLRGAYPGFSAILFSGAMASVYFTTYAAFVYYALFSFAVTYILMVIFTLCTVTVASRYNRQEIAILGLVGAYAIPFLISPNTGNPAMLFLYMAIINGGIVFLSIKKDWIVTGRLAQAITWLIFIGWLVMQEAVTAKGTGLVYMCVFFLLFTANAIAPKLFRQEALGKAHAYQLLTNNLALSLAALYVFGYSFENATMAFIALSLSVFVGAQAALFHGWNEKVTRNLLAYYALSLFVLFIGIQWSGITVTLLWLLTAVVVFVLGARRKSNPLRMTGITLIGITLLKLLVLDSLTFSTLQKVIAYLVLGVLLLLVSFFYQKFRKQLFEE